MDRQLAFSTFLKLMELPEPQKAATLRGFMRGGGYNYWRPMQVLAPEVAAGELDLSGIQQKVGLMAKGHQRKYNEIALTNLLKWVSRRKLSLRTPPEKTIKKFGNSGLRVRLEPELAFTMSRRNYVMHIWATNNPSLSEETLSMGLYFLRRHLRTEKNAEDQYLIFDTVKNRVFAEFGILHNALELLKLERKLLSKLWTELNRPTKKPAEDSTLEDRVSFH